MGRYVPVADQVTWFQSLANECAIGWNDSGCFWHFAWGPRGAGNMMPDIGERFAALEAGEYLEDALAALREHVEAANG